MTQAFCRTYQIANIITVVQLYLHVAVTRKLQALTCVKGFGLEAGLG